MKHGAEFEAGGRRYRSRPMCAVDQWRLLSRLRPILPALAGMDYALRTDGAGVGNIAVALAPLINAPDDDMRAVFRGCLAAVERAEDSDWRAIDVMPPLPVLMRIATEVVAANFSALFAMKRPSFKPIPTDRVVYEPVSMPDGDDWLYRPVLRQLCKAESLLDGVLRIENIAKLNDAIDVEDENQARARKAAEKKR